MPNNANDSNVDVLSIRCRLKVRVDQAGYDSKEALMERIRRYPHLRACPRTLNKYGMCGWTKRIDCLKCPHVVREESLA